MSFEHRETVRFGQVDAAGIVYYPRLHEMLSNTVEAWFTEVLEAPWQRLHGEENRGTPIVRTECTYIRASRLGERLVFTLDVVRLGRSSFDLAIVARCEGEVRLEAQVRHAFVQLRPLEARPIPDELRARMT